MCLKPNLVLTVLRWVKFKLTINTRVQGVDINLCSKEHFDNSMWIEGKGMKGLSLKRLIHLIPSDWIRGIPKRAGSGYRLGYTDF